MLTYKDGICTTWPLIGTYTERESSLRVAVPDYPYYYGQQDGITTGIQNNDPINWPIQTYMIDNIPNLYKSDAISQFSLNGIEALVTIERGGTITDTTAFKRENRALLPGTYRMWLVRVEIVGRATVENLIVVPDESGRYITVNEALSFLSEFLNQPGEFTVHYWDFSFIRESTGTWQPVTDFITTQRYDGNGHNFGVRVIQVDNQNRIEMSNKQGNDYILGNVHFKI